MQLPACSVGILLSPFLRRWRGSVRDYWAARQLPPGDAELQKAPRKKGRFVYSAEIEIPAGRLDVGKYFELHVEISRESGGGVREFSGLASMCNGSLAKTSSPN